MNKSEFITHIADQHKCTKIEAEKVIDMFTSSVIEAIGQGKEISLILASVILLLVKLQQETDVILEQVRH